MDLLRPDPDSICIQDIAHALSLTNRFTGHTHVPYSVAQHSHTVSMGLPTLAAHLHDAHEAFLGDISTPLKRAVPEFEILDRLWIKAIESRFGVDFSDPAIKEMDHWVLTQEFEQQFTPWDWATAKTRFLERYYELGGK